MSGIRNVLIGVTTTLALAAPASAQVAAEQLLGKMEDVGISWLLPKDLNAGMKARAGYGFEFSFGVGDLKRKVSDAERLKRCKDAAKPPAVVCDEATRTAYERTIASISGANGKWDTTFTIAKRDLDEVLVGFELAVGTRFTELEGELVPGWELEGRVQEFPSLSLYATLRPDLPVSPYLGVSLTPAELKNVRLVQGDSAATVEDNAVGGAAVAGLVYEVAAFNVFAQAEYSVLQFQTRNWKRPAIFPAGAALPTLIDMSGWRFSLGLQLHVGGS